MTLKQLADAILMLPPDEQDKPAGVWPPNACPESSFVHVAGLDKTPAGEPVISTGKQPAVSAE